MQRIIDAHCHAYPDPMANAIVGHVADFYGLPVRFDGRMDTLLACGKRAGVTHFVVSSVATTPRQVSAINRFIAECVREHPGLVTGLGTLHPESPDPEADLEELTSLGLLGVKLHPDFQRTPMDDPGYLRIFELCQGKLPVLCHFGDARYDFSNPLRARRVLDQFKGLTMIGAHLGGWSVWKQAVAELCGYENLLVDCSSSFYALSEADAAALIRSYGAERVLFGTDYPMWNPASEVEFFNRMRLHGGERDAILYKNAARVFGLDIDGTRP